MVYLWFKNLSTCNATAANVCWQAFYISFPCKAIEHCAGIVEVYYQTVCRSVECRFTVMLQDDFRLVAHVFKYILIKINPIYFKWHTLKGKNFIIINSNTMNMFYIIHFMVVTWKKKGLECWEKCLEKFYQTNFVLVFALEQQSCNTEWLVIVGEE